MLGFKKLLSIPSRDEALPGRPTPIPTAKQHFVNGNPLKGPYPPGLETAIFGMGCFWGAERKFWELGEGIYATAVGYAAGHTPNPTYEEVCSGRTGHNEVVLVVYDPGKVLVREAAQDVLGEPRPDAGHAPGQRRRHAVPLRHLHHDAGAEEGRRGVEGDVRAGAAEDELRRDHDGESSPRRSSISPRTITSSIWRRIRWATAGSAAPACRARSAPERRLPRTDRNGMM